jgi:hypothetical protein
MTENIQFTRNHSDLSNNRGFQFEFYCDRCGSGFRTPFKPSITGSVTGALGTASNLFGSIFNKAADLSESVRSANWERERDAAFQDAMKTLRPEFLQCPRCSSWVCKKSCWNAKRGLCKNCAPDLATEMAAAQSAKAVEGIWTGAQASEEDQAVISDPQAKKVNLQASCPECHAPLDKNAKFCPECGAKLQRESFCSECGAKIPPGAKFCPECGHKNG